MAVLGTERCEGARRAFEVPARGTTARGVDLVSDAAPDERTSPRRERAFARFLRTRAATIPVPGTIEDAATLRSTCLLSGADVQDAVDQLMICACLLLLEVCYRAQ
jgi:hypothetical protein